FASRKARPWPLQRIARARILVKSRLPGYHGHTWRMGGLKNMSMNAARRVMLSAALAVTFGAPAGAQVELPPPPGAVDLPVPAAPALAVPAPRMRVAADPRIELMSLLVSRTPMGKLQQDDVAIAYRSAV